MNEKTVTHVELTEENAETSKPLSLRKERIKVLKVNIKTGVRTGRWCGNYTMSQVRAGC